MTHLIRRAILALALIAGLSPAFAQVPPPVPALPDTERRTSYSISASTCACAVGFQLYGDSTDYQNWIEVWINGVQIPQPGNWTIASPSGSLATLPRPITNAVLTFTAAQTGTVQIVGARRPRRASQFPENRGVAARDFNQALTDIVAQNRETWDRTNDITGRAVLAPAGETLALLPVLASRANMGACFDNSGNLSPCATIPSSTFIAGSNITFSGSNPTLINNNLPNAASLTWVGTQNFNGDVCFKTGKPWADITCWGAVGNNSTVNDTAVQNAINALVTAGGGTIYTPPGTYCFGTGVTNTGNNTIRFVGASARVSIWSACGNNITPLTMNSALSLASDMDFFGKGWNGDTSACCATAPAFKIDTGCIFCQINNAEIQGGAGVHLLGGDWYLHHVTANQSYGNAIYYIKIGGFAVRAAADQNFPVSNPSGTVTVANWTALTPVTSGTNTMLTCGGFIYQIKTSGTTGASCPTIKNYFIDITDGSAVLQLAGPTTYYGWQIDTGASEVALMQIDASCWVCTAGVAMTNSLAGSSPSFLSVHQSVLLGLGQAVLGNDGQALNVTDSHGTCQLSGCPVINLKSNWVGDATISSNHFTTSPTGVLVSAGSGLALVGNRFQTISSWAVDVLGNINGLTATGNIFGSVAGAAANGIRIQAGTGTHISVVGNICNNVTGACISNSASGTVYVPAGGNP